MSLTTIKLFVTAVIWGGTFIAGRMLGGEIAPFSASFLRFVAANIFLVGFFLWKEGTLPRLDARTLLLLCGLGATGVFLYNVFFLWGLTTCLRGARPSSWPETRCSSRFCPSCSSGNR